MKENRLFPSLLRLLPREETMVRLLLAFMAMFVSVQGAWAQGAYGYTIPPDWDKAQITDIGVVVRDMEFYVREDLQTHKVDTMLLISEPEIFWRSQSVNVYDSTSVDRAMTPHRSARKKVLQDDAFGTNCSYTAYDSSHAEPRKQDRRQCRLQLCRRQGRKQHRILGRPCERA